MNRFALVLMFLSMSGSGVLCAAETGQIAGQLADTQGRITFAGEAVVFLCDAKTGIPIHMETKQPSQIGFRELHADKFWHATTKPNGAFEFNGVPVGAYRLVAQSWSGTSGLPKLTGDTSTFVTLHGVAENVVVKSGERTVVYPRQLGNGVLTITNDPEEAHAFLLISLKPTLGDAILGPFGWGDEFVSQLVGVTHMEQPHVTISGLPDTRDVHVALMNYDNNPGVGNGSYKAGQREGRLRIVASWSNGHHEPPPELLALTDHLEKNKLTFADFVTAAEKGKTEQEVRQKLQSMLREDPRREVEVAGLGKRRLFDVVAALSYVQLRTAVRK